MGIEATEFSQINTKMMSSSVTDFIIFSSNGNYLPLVINVILFNLKKIKKFHRKEKHSGAGKRAQNRSSVMQIVTARTTTIRTPYVHIVLNGVSFPQI